MKSRTALPFLRRLNLLSSHRHEPPYQPFGAKSHRRPVVAHPDLLGEDNPRDRVVTVKQEDRIPYREVEGLGRPNDRR